MDGDDSRRAYPARLDADHRSASHRFSAPPIRLQGVRHGVGMPPGGGDPMLPEGRNLAVRHGGLEAQYHVRVRIYTMGGLPWENI